MPETHSSSVCFSSPSTFSNTYSFQGAEIFFNSRPSETSAGESVNNFFTLWCLLSPKLICPFSIGSIQVWGKLFFSTRNFRQGTLTVSTANIAPNTSPARTSHQWCLLSPILVNEHATAHMHIIDWSHGLRSTGLRFDSRFCKYHTTKIVVYIERAEWPEGNDLLESDANQSESNVLVQV